MKFQLTATMTAALPVIKQLEEHGYEAVFVGGAVRDMLLGLPINDIDIASSALPEQTMQIFPHTIPTGLQHGTVTVIDKGIPYEITTYREESQYEAHRKPKQVSFISDLDNDLLRRDFTMNAMAIRANGELHDPYGGHEDMMSSIVRCVGYADLRFLEDALRMLRAVRFMGAYHYKPALSTWRSLKRHRSLLVHIAMERVHAELDKMIKSEKPHRALGWLAASGLLLFCKESLVLPYELQQSMMDVQKNTFNNEALYFLQEIEQLDLRWASLFVFFNWEEKDALATMAALRLSGDRTKTIHTIMKIHTIVRTNINEQNMLMKRWREVVLTYSESMASKWLLIAHAMKHGTVSISENVLDLLKTEMEKMPVKSMKQLKINGSHLQRQLGREGGPWLSMMLKRLLESAAAGEVCNETDKLAALAKLWNEEGN
ncbi:CCA tRNA nucleotidyltransferase [Paenibacillus sp. GSMTC-2017]|uniref:CCA tRNA nucleotidyltransferase n=1 Tax=Paenibacillus sp. GSMTC-2017 TaxID=2794350 RepID=UPI0018D8D30E|nr:CCA tRNA nucleotidyltransferase [Paenibacillus sp. GSMTC-2017]MBH5317924.1 CCA tRNA nucleotidyltransferase [Paenibacillus sp. GSMTC-2017]